MRTDNHSYSMIRKSGECVINLPTSELLQEIIGIGNCHGGDPTDKFERFSLMALNRRNDRSYHDYRSPDIDIAHCF